MIEYVFATVSRYMCATSSGCDFSRIFEDIIFSAIFHLVPLGTRRQRDYLHGEVSQEHARPHRGKMLSIGEINALPAEQFEWLFGNVVEHVPAAARYVASKRPFDTAEALKRAFDEYLDRLELTEKENILIKHPDLAGKLAEEGKLTNESQIEQKSAGLDSITAEEKQLLNNLNLMYREKFKFPFVICARENKLAAILSGIEIRMKNSRETEVSVGIEEVKKICRLRINDLAWPDV